MATMTAKRPTRKAIATRLALLLSLVAFCGVALAVHAMDRRAVSSTPEEGTVIDHTVKDNQGQDVDLSTYRGTALLIVNTASECGFTPQLETLETLYQRYQERGFAVLAFPSNDFGGQEPGDNAQIEQFYCEGPFRSTFPIFDKVVTSGDNIAPLFRALTDEVAEDLRGPIRWNFEKFLVSPDGHVVARFGSRVEPLDDALVSAVEGVLPR